MSEQRGDKDSGAAQLVGRSMDRIDGRLKVTGSARYVARVSLDEKGSRFTVDSPLVGLGSSLPAPLVHQLRDAAIQGRVKRLEQLADEAGRYSTVAAAEIRALAADFRYDAVQALDAQEADDVGRLGHRR